MRQLTWFEKGNPVGTEVLNALEKIIGYRLPADVADFAKQNSGATNPEECEFVALDSAGREYISNFGGLLAFEGEGQESILGILRELRVDDQLPPSVIPIINTGFGDYVCLDYRSGSEPQIVYFAHERSGEDSLFFIAQTFTQFLEILTIPKD
jgi:hypothetical protein